MKIFKVIRTGFDSMENRDPEYKETIGHFSTKTKAENKIEELNKKEKKYKGYHDDTLYPIYTIKVYEVE